MSIHIPDEQELFEEENEAMFREALEEARKIRAAKGISQPAPAEPAPSTEQDATLLEVMKDHPGLTYEKAEEMAKAFGF